MTTLKWIQQGLHLLRNGCCAPPSHLLIWVQELIWVVFTCDSHDHDIQLCTKTRWPTASGAFFGIRTERFKNWTVIASLLARGTSYRTCHTKASDDLRVIKNQFCKKLLWTKPLSPLPPRFQKAQASVVFKMGTPALVAINLLDLLAAQDRK